MAMIAIEDWTGLRVAMKTRPPRTTISPERKNGNFVHHI
jgi:hypothetical protein